MRRAALLALVAAAVLAAPAHAADPLTGRLLVSLERHDRHAAHAAADVLARASARRAGPAIPEIGLVTVRPAAGTTPGALARRLRRDPAVRAVSLERRAAPRLVPNDPALVDPETAPGTPPGTSVEWWAGRMGLFEAWDIARGAGALVAVIDTGVDGGHPELAPKIRAAVDTDPTAGSGGALTDELGHGTHVASLACAAAGDGLGMAGAGLDCGLLVIKTDFTDASVVHSVMEAAHRRADVINLSFGTDGSRKAPPALMDALRYATARGAVLVAAAADVDTEEQGDPANLVQPTGTGPDLTSNVGLSVTAATLSGARAGFAGRGSQISLAAYGAFEESGTGPNGIFGALPAAMTDLERGSLVPPAPACDCRTSSRGDTRYAYLKGTSMATAIVSGVAALVSTLNPDLRPPEIVRLLKATARRPAGTGWSPELGWGIVDAHAAVDAARHMDRRAPVSRIASRARRSGRPAITLRWRGSDAAPRGVDASGIAAYELWRSLDGRRATRIARTSDTSRRVRLRSGSRYAFFTVAIDRAGNRERRPSRPDVRVLALR